MTTKSPIDEGELVLANIVFQDLGRTFMIRGLSPHIMLTLAALSVHTSSTVDGKPLEEVLDDVRRMAAFLGSAARVSHGD